MMRTLRAVLVAALLGGAFVTLVPQPALAQSADDDWDVKRNPFDPRVIAGYKGILARNPDDASALRKLMALYGRYSSLDKLVAEYEAKLKGKDGPQFADVMILGHIWRARNDVPRAVARYEEAARLKPQAPSVHLALAELYRQSQRPADALAAYERAMPLAKDKKTQKIILRAAADLALEQKDIKKARDYYEKYIALDPHDVTTRIDLGEALSKHELHAESLEEYRKAEKQLGTDPARRVEVIARIGYEEEALGRTDDAVATYRRCMELTQKGHYLRKELTQRIIAIYEKKQDLRSLAAYYEKAWSAGSRGWFEWSTLADLYDRVGEQDKAIAAYKAAVKAAPYELGTQRDYIKLLDRAGREAEVLAQYETVIRVAPGEPEFQTEYAKRVWNKGDRKKALELAKTIAAHFPDDAGVHSALAEMYSSWGEEALALKEYEFLARLEPEDESHLVDLGEQYFQRGDRGRAIEIWKKIIVRKTPEAYARLAEVYADHDFGSEALDMYRRAIELKPKDAMLWRGLAMAFERVKGNDDNAVTAWKKVLEMTAGQAAQKPLRKEARTHIIGVLYRKQQGGQALRIEATAWDRKLQGTPPDLEAGTFAAEAYVRLGKYEEAERALLRILKITPDDADTMVALVAVYKSEFKLKEALALLEVLVKIPGREREFYSQMAELALAMYDDEGAVKYANEALKRSPNDAKSQQRLAEIHEARGELDAAAEAYEKAVRAAPLDFELAFSLAKLQLRRNKPDEAVKLYRQVMRLAKDEDTVRRAARLAIDYEEYMGTLGDLERELSPLVYSGGKPYYRRILVELYGRYVPILRARVNAGDAAAKRDLAAISDRSLRPLLEALADEDDPQQRRIAVATLGELGNVAAARPLLKLAAYQPPPRPLTPVTPGQPAPLTELHEGPSNELKMAALVAAGKIVDGSLVGDLTPLARNSEDKTFRVAAVWALGHTGDARAVPVLIAALDDAEEDWQVRSMAALALGRLGDKRGLAAVAARVAAQGELKLRGACAYALGVAAKGVGQEQLLSLLARPGGGDTDVVPAIWALGRMADRRVVPLLVTSYFVSNDHIRAAILWALPRASGQVPVGEAPVETELEALGEGTNVSTILERLPPELPNVAPSFATVAHQKAAVLTGLKQALGKPDKVLQALHDLDALPDRLALGALSLGRDEASAGDQQDMDQLMGQVAKEITPLVLPLLDSPDSEVRALAVSVVGKAGQPGGDEQVARALGDKDDAVRRAALQVAPLAARAANKPTLVRAVAQLGTGSESWQERALCARTLGVMAASSDEAITRLAQLAHDDGSAFVREEATRVLGDSRSPRAVDGLLAASHDPVVEVRLAAVKGLKGIKDSRAEERLGQLARDAKEDQRVRAAAKK